MKVNLDKSDNTKRRNLNRNTDIKLPSSNYAFTPYFQSISVLTFARRRSLAVRMLGGRVSSRKAAKSLTLEW